MRAECQCGRLTVDLPGAAAAVGGESTRFERPTAAGGVFETFFRPRCGSTVFARASKHPNMVGVALGAIADPDFPPPVRSVWEESRHR